MRIRLGLAVALVAATALSVRLAGRGPIRLEVGGFQGRQLQGDWSRSSRADVDPQAALDGRTSFYYRAAPINAGVSLPLVVLEGPLRLTLRGTARVRSALGAFVAGRPAGELLVRAGPWDRYTLEVPAERVRGVPVDVSLALRPLPLVRGAHSDNPEVLVDYLEVDAPRLALSASACLLVAAVPAAILLLALWLGVNLRWGVAIGLAAAAGTIALGRTAPLQVVLAAPRLVPLALLAAMVVHALAGRMTRLTALDRGLLAGLVAVGVLFHGSLVFFPDHNPPDIDIHVRRTLDLGGVAFEYQALLRYGSQLPTASQDQGAATAALGERMLIPYSPLPYVFWYLAHLLGMDLSWGLVALDALLAMAVVPLLWACAQWLWCREAAWIAALLYALDLAVWHHVGRSHAPAVFGAALGTAALLFLALQAEKLESRRSVLIAGGVLGTAVLGYSSLAVLFGLFGLVVLLLLFMDARGLSPRARRGVAGALVLGGLLAGALFYFHYVPGLLGGATTVEAEPDLFPGRTFFVFHNESRQSMRLWVLGYWIPLVAGLAAAPAALVRARPSARPILVAWLCSWALIMFLKEPFLFPKLLRWAKEDQFLSPLLCLFIAAAVTALPRPWMRRAATALAVGTALWLQLRDFAHHADSLKL